MRPLQMTNAPDSDTEVSQDPTSRKGDRRLHGARHFARRGSLAEPPLQITGCFEVVLDKRSLQRADLAAMPRKPDGQG